MAGSPEAPSALVPVDVAAAGAPLQSLAPQAPLAGGPEPQHGRGRQGLIGKAGCSPVQDLRVEAVGGQGARGVGAVQLQVAGRLRMSPRVSVMCCLIDKQCAHACPDRRQAFMHVHHHWHFARCGRAAGMACTSAELRQAIRRERGAPLPA